MGVDMADFSEKCSQLHQMLAKYTQRDTAAAFSGGVDSALLLKMLCGHAQANKTQVYAVTVSTKLHPAKETEQARRLAGELGAVHVELFADELDEAGISDNPVDRCYLCKRCLFAKIRHKAAELGADLVMDGTIEEDLHEYRPGLKALRELDIISPLAQAGFSKQDVRRLAAEYGLSVSDKPSSPCLATRFPYGTALSYEELHKVEAGEAFLKDLGLYNVRIRVHGEIARIETDTPDFPLLLEHREKTVTYLKELGYSYITIDLEGFRSGSMDIHINNCLQDEI